MNSIQCNSMTFYIFILYLNIVTYSLNSIQCNVMICFVHCCSLVLWAIGQFWFCEVWDIVIYLVQYFGLLYCIVARYCELWDHFDIVSYLVRYFGLLCTIVVRYCELFSAMLWYFEPFRYCDLFSSIFCSMCTIVARYCELLDHFDIVSYLVHYCWVLCSILWAI